MNTLGSAATMSGRRSPRIRPSIFQCCSVRVAMLWEAAERLRRDFEASGLPPKICSSFAPRVTGGKGTLEADHLVDGWKRYKKAMDNIGQTLRPIAFYVCIGGEAGTRLGTQKRDDPASGPANPSFGPSRACYGLAKLPTVSASPRSTLPGRRSRSAASRSNSELKVDRVSARPGGHILPLCAIFRFSPSHGSLEFVFLHEDSPASWMR
jgi:hypothetical protein